MNAPTSFSGLQTAIAAAARLLDDGREHDVDEFIAEVGKHKPALVAALTEAERLAAVDMTFEGLRIADGGLGWMQLGLVAATRGYSPDETSIQRWSRIMETHSEAGDMRWPELTQFREWTKAYRQEQERSLAETERHIAIMVETGAPTLGKALEQTTASIISRAQQGPQ